MSAQGAGKASGMASLDASMPERIELGARHHRLCLRWPDGLEATLGAATLRSACRCAACAKARQGGAELEIDARIGIDEVVPFGIAGLQLAFSDGHRRGIFPWEYLRQLATRAG